MILYSIVSPEIVFDGYDDTKSIRYFEAEYRGEKVIVAQTGDRDYKISRLMSTCPSTFLDPAFQPGRVLRESDLK